MSTVAHLITAEELFNMGISQRCELVKGEVRYMSPSGFEHGRVIIKLSRLLANHVEDQRLGVVLGAETGFTLARNPDTVRGADVSFISAARLPSGSHPVGYWEGAPDLAVEVISPSDRRGQIEEKVREYLAAGSRLVWVIHPARKTITVHRADSSVNVLHEKDTLDGEDVVPGFRCTVAEIFA